MVPPINPEQYAALKKRYPNRTEEEYIELYRKMQKGELDEPKAEAKPRIAQPDKKVDMSAVARVMTGNKQAPVKLENTSVTEKPFMSTPAIPRAQAIVPDRNISSTAKLVVPASIGATGSVTSEPFVAAQPVTAAEVKPAQNGNKPSMAGIANAAMGIASFAGGMLAKKPTMADTRDYTPQLRPAQGDERGLQDNLSQINSGVRSVANDARAQYGSNASAYAQARLGAQANAARATQQAFGQNANLLRQDQNRVEEGVNRARLFNTQQQNYRDMVKFQSDTQQFGQQQEASRQASQNSINYMAQSEANKHNNAIATKQANQQLDMMYEADRYEYEQGLRKQGVSGASLQKELDAFKNRYEKYKYSQGGAIKKPTLRKK